MNTHLTIEELYTPQSRIAAEFQARQIACAPESSNPLEELLLARPHAVLLRNVLTPNFETTRFVSIATALGLRPLVLEFHADKFVMMNPAKAPLGVLQFSAAPATGSTDGLSIRVIDCGRCSGQPMHSLNTLGGGSLVKFHHDLAQSVPGSAQASHYDASKWIAAQGGRAANYYKSVFRLFVAHAVLFESYLCKGKDQAFTESIVLPSFAAVTEEQGHKPLICRLDPPDSEGCGSWYHYPASLYPHVAAQAAMWAMAGNQKSITNPSAAHSSVSKPHTAAIA